MTWHSRVAKTTVSGGNAILVRRKDGDKQVNDIKTQLNVSHRIHVDSAHEGETELGPVRHVTVVLSSSTDDVFWTDLEKQVAIDFQQLVTPKTSNPVA